MQERDNEMLEKMHEAMGGKDMSNVEMENGKPETRLKRNVRDNMFRYI
jgi:hypothetical protein